MLFFIISPELLPSSVVQGYRQDVPKGTKNAEGMSPDCNQTQQVEVGIFVGRGLALSGSCLCFFFDMASSLRTGLPQLAMSGTIM
ncbi:MAG: hypothetical protein H8D45_14885 [Bacteroidetes bacterium]|nr:hypothetical protein [Bacteroidota bacterium]MBL7102950.1 hypothetical protein [Bacteroidales bacterium]